MPAGFGLERERAVAGLLAAGMTVREAGAAAGVSKSWAGVVRQKMGGVYRPAECVYSDRYLSRDERYEIARLLDDDPGAGVRQIARRIGRSPPAVSRELRRNACPRTGNYIPERAHTLAWQRQRRPKTPKISGCPRLKETVQALLDRKLSPEQASGRLKRMFPDDELMRVSHETIYQSIYVYPRGGLRKELTASLRTGRQLRVRRGRRPRAGAIVDAVPIGQRPAEAEGRLVPGHHEGDLIKGSVASNSAVATLVERTTGFLILIPLPDGYTADKVAEAVTDRLTEMPAWFTRSLTWDRGSEMARHKQITAQAGIQVYFADPHAPWQRGSNENTNGLIREYLPKGTDLNATTPQQLQHIADELNDRPRKRHDYLTPREVLTKLIEQNSVATTP